MAIHALYMYVDFLKYILYIFLYLYDGHGNTYKDISF